MDTSDSYILPRFRRLFVYVYGLVVNVILMSIVILFFPKYTYVNSFILINVLLNFLPNGAIKTDGYHIWINNIFNVNDYKYRKNKLFIIIKFTFYFICFIMILATFCKLIW